MKWRAAPAAVMMFAAHSFAQPVDRFTLRPDILLYNVPLSISLEELTPLPEAWQHVLYRVDEDKRIPIASQTGPEALWFRLDKPVAPGQTITLELTCEKTKDSKPANRIVEDDKQITLKHCDQDIVSYYFALQPVPEGVDPIYRRSGFLHPLVSPAGHVLTRIQPPDHRHHYGLWNPWTKTHIEGREVDFWNLHRKLGTVRHAGFISKTEGPVFAAFCACHEHIMFQPDGTEKIAMKEVLTVETSVADIEGQTVWILDHISTFTNVLNTPIELAWYRYGGGLCLRAPESWTKDTCTVLTSEGKSRDEADGTRARWADLRGQSPDGQSSGIVFMSHIENYEHPEPVRVWPSDANGGRGDLMFDYSPTRLSNWIIAPDETNTLRYRLIVYDGEISPETAETLWSNFSCPPVVIRND